MRALLVDTLQKVANFGEPDGAHLDEAQAEDGDWMRELARLCQSILHHVNAVASLGKALPMQNEHGEEEAQVEDLVILVAQRELFKEEHREDEGDLDEEHEKCTVEYVNLVVRLETELVFVASHEGTVRNSVHISRQLHGLGRLVVLAGRRSGLVNDGAVVLSEDLSGSLALALSHGLDHDLNAISDIVLVDGFLVGALRSELLMEHKLFLPLVVASVPEEPLEARHTEHEEVQHNVLHENGSPPNAVLIF